jgi:dihydrofolate reductase
MRLSLIWAMTENRTIGRDNALPWRLPDEMAHFKRTTIGKPVIMGRMQFEAMGRPLPRRANIVLSRNAQFAPEGARVVRTLEEAIACAQAQAGDADEIMVIGGAEIYALALPRADRLYCTVIHTQLEGDTHFPEFDPDSWRQVSREEHPADARHAYAYTVTVLERN